MTTIFLEIPNSTVEDKNYQCWHYHTQTLLRIYLITNKRLYWFLNYEALDLQSSQSQSANKTMIVKSRNSAVLSLLTFERLVCVLTRVRWGTVGYPRRRTRERERGIPGDVVPRQSSGGPRECSSPRIISIPTNI